MPPKKSSKAFEKLVQSLLAAKFPDRPTIPEGFDYVEPALYDCAHLVYQSTNTGNSVYLGPKAAASRGALGSLKAANIRGIVNCTPDFPCYHRAEGIAYCQVPVHDIETADILVYLKGATEFIHYILEQEGGGSVLVHCQFGVSRSASVVLAYYMRCQNSTRDEAFVAVKTKRPKICPNEGFWKQLKLFQEQYHSQPQPEESGSEKKQPNKDQKVPLVSTSRHVIPIDNSWALRSNATFTTCRDIPSILSNDKDWIEIEKDTAVDPFHVLNVCLDFVWGRGLIKVDLEWLKRICCALQESHKFTTDSVTTLISIVKDEDSDFCSRWSGEVYPEQIDRLERFLSEDD